MIHCHIWCITLRRNKGIAAKPLTTNEKMELTLLQIEFDKLTTNIKKKEKELENENDGEEEEEEEEKEHRGKAKNDSDKESDSEDDEEDDEVEDVADIPDKLKQKYPKFRTSVSSEAFGIFNKKAEFKARVIAKDQDTLAKIKQRLNESFMFANLDEKELKIVIDAMEVKNYKPKQVIIKQRDDGNEMFLVGEGKLD